MPDPALSPPDSLAFTATAAGLVTLGGMLGTGARFAITELTSTLPALLIVNAVGTLLLGCITSALVANPAPWARLTQLGAGTGFCGAFTTCSALAVFFAEANPTARILSMLVFFILGVATAGTGWLAGRLLRGRPQPRRSPA